MEPYLSRTVSIPATTKNRPAQAICHKTANRLCWSRVWRPRTHNPLVAGSSPARPTKFRLVRSSPGRFAANGSPAFPALYRRTAALCGTS
jgi:hypothetical protein